MAQGKAEKDSKAAGSTIMKVVETIAITPEDARAIVCQYEIQARAKHADASDDKIKKLVANKIIKRYAKLAATSGGATSLRVSYQVSAQRSAWWVADSQTFP